MLVNINLNIYSSALLFYLYKIKTYLLKCPRSDAENKEISALLHLIDDPDEEVFITVSERIVSLGRAIMPNLENLWETTPDEGVQERIEMLIHKLHFRDLINDLTEWKNGR